MSKQSAWKKFKYYVFGIRDLALSDFIELSVIDEERGISIVQDDRAGRIYIKRELKEYDIAKYQYLKKHPVDNTPKICYFEEKDGVLILIEQFMPGDSLEFALKKKGLMDENKVIDISRQLCTILSDYHSCEPAIVNHNLNPANIKVSVNGIVRLMETNIEKYNRANAKVAELPEADSYVAPEKNSPDYSGIPGDIYSLGVLMNVLLAGEHPDAGIAEGPLEDIIRKCVSPDTSERFQSASELSEALSAVKNSLSFKERLSSWNRYLLPGFRGKNVYIWSFAAMAYPMLLYICVGMNFGEAGAWSLLGRIIFCLGVLALVLFNGNYLDVKKRCPLTRSKRRFKRWRGILIMNILILLVTLGLIWLLTAIF